MIDEKFKFTKRLSDLEFEEIQIGQNVRSINTGVLGQITEFLSPPVCDDTIVIQWDNGNNSLVYHTASNFIEIIE